MLENLKANRNKIIILIVVAISSFLIGYNALPAKVEIQKDESAVKQLVELKSKYEELVQSYQKLQSTHERKTKVLVTNADGSSRLEESSDSVSIIMEMSDLRKKVSDLNQRNEALVSQISYKSVEQNKQRALFGGPGFSSDGNWRAGIDAVFGNFMASVNGGPVARNEPYGHVKITYEVAGYLKWGFYY
jgi:hypothetical protein